VNGHYFQDGNKRTGLATMLMFLDMNGFDVTTDEIALADRMVGRVLVERKKSDMQ
jgi:prophage maintenance system killer protein